MSLKIGYASKYPLSYDVLARLGADIALVLLLISVPVSAISGASTLVAEKFSVESDPPGADVYLMDRHVGVTPITVNERDIYPNTYSNEQANLYGKVIMRKPGCREYSRFVTLDDVSDGLKAKLDCSSTKSANESVSQKHDSDRRTTEPFPRAERHLHQLKVLQELLDEGLITEQEEKEIRKRVLESR